MTLLLLGDSNVERPWLNVRNNRDLLRTAVFVAVNFVVAVIPNRGFSIAIDLLLKAHTVSSDVVLVRKCKL